MRWKIGRATVVSLDYQYLQRDDDASVSRTISANELWLRFGYLVGEGVAGGGFGAL